MNREELISEINELEQDLLALKKSRDAIQQRVINLEGTTRYKEFVSWPAIVALTAVQVMAIVRCEGLIEDYRHLLDQMETPDNIRKLYIARRNGDDITGE